MTTSVSQD